MKFIVKNGEIDRYATEDEFIELRGIIVEDLRRIMLYLERCTGDKKELVSLLDQMRKTIYHSGSKDSLLSLTDDYVAFNLPGPESFDARFKSPRVVIIKRNMGGIYFVDNLETLNVHFVSREYDESQECLHHYKVKYYDIANFKVEEYAAILEKYSKEDSDDVTIKPNEFASEVDKVLNKVVQVPQ